MRRWVLLCAIVFSLAACGGGGGGGSAPSLGSVPAGGSAATPTPATPLSANTALQRSLVQQSLTSASEAPAIAGYAAGGSTVTYGMVRRAFSTARTAQSVTTTSCSDGETTSSSPGTGSSINFTENQYYDAACTQLWWVGTFVATETQTQYALTGSIVYYTAAGVVYEYVNPATITLTASNSVTAISTGGTVYANQSSPALGSYGVGCSVVTGSASCSIGDVAHLSTLNLDDGVSATATASGSTTGAGTTVTISGSGSSYSGALNALSLTQQGTYIWSVLGAAPTLSVAVSGSVSTSTTGVLAALTLAVTDTTDGAAVAVSYNASSGLITGTVAPASGGAGVASFSVSTTGTGTVTYGNGATAQVVNWVAQS